MRFGHDTRGNGSYLAVFDVGATSVGVGITHNAGGITSVLWNTRIEYSYQAYDEYTRYERAMYSTLLDVGMKLLGEGMSAARATHPQFKPERMRVVCVLESPWFLGAVGSAERAKETPFVMDADELTALEQQARTAASQANEGHSWHEVVGESELLEEERQQLELNGYVVTSPAHDGVTSARVSTYQAFIGVAVKKQILQILERVLPHHEVTITTSTLLLTKHYRATVGRGTGHRVYLVEVEGRITSIASIERGVLTVIRTIPLGTNHILNAAAPDALSTEEARGVLTVALKTHTADSSLPLPAPIAKASDEWRDAVLEECRNQSHGVVPPEHMLLLVSRRWNPILIPLLTQPWTVPGLRKERQLTVTQLIELIAQPNPAPVEKPSLKPLPDSKVLLFAHALFYTTHP